MSATNLHREKDINFLEVDKIKKLLPKGYRLGYIPADTEATSEVLMQNWQNLNDVNPIERKVTLAGCKKRSWEKVGYLKSFCGLLMDRAIFMYKNIDPGILQLFQLIADKLGIKIELV